GADVPVNGEPAEPGAAMTEEERVAARARLSTLLAELATLQGEQPLVLPSVDAQAVGTVVSDWTGIPVGRMVKDEIAAVLKLSDTLSKRVIGQEHALYMNAWRSQNVCVNLQTLYQHS